MVAVVVVTAVLFASPVLYVLWRGYTLDPDIGRVLRDIREPLWRTIQLSVLVSVATGIVGTWLAWLLVRTDVPAAGFLRVLAPLLSSLVRPQGRLVLAGLLERQADEIASCYPRFDLRAWKTVDGWTCLAGPAHA